MANISQMELDSLRHIIGASLTGARKFEMYANQAQDMQLKQMLQTEAQKCQQKAQHLMGFLQ
jgi:hypothetical protein